MGGVLNIPIDAGATRRIAFTVTVDAEPVDFTGATVSYHSTHATKTLAVAGNVLSVELTPDDTRRGDGAKYVIDVTWPGGDVTRLLSGYLHANRLPEGT